MLTLYSFILLVALLSARAVRTTVAITRSRTQAVITASAPIILEFPYFTRA